MTTTTTATTTKRQREDGTWTYATADWDAKWYWPTGTRVVVQFSDATLAGTVTKENSISVWVTFDAGTPRTQKVHKTYPGLTREGGK
jgi:hypothetical protein